MDNKYNEFISRWEVISVRSDRRSEEVAQLYGNDLALFQTWRRLDTSYQSYDNSSIFENFKTMHLDGITAEVPEAVAQFTKNHADNLEKLEHNDISLARLDNDGQITAIYKTSNGLHESIATIQIDFSQNGVSVPAFQARFMELEVNGQPTLVVTALQKYTDEEATIARLKKENPKRLEKLTKDSALLEKVEHKFGFKFETLALLTVLALAKAKGEKQALLVPYEYQLWKQFHENNKDGVVIPNVYDPIAKLVGMRRSSEVNSWWMLRNNGPVSVDAGIKVSPLEMASAQNAYSRMIELLR